MAATSTPFLQPPPRFNRNKTLQLQKSPKIFLPQQSGTPFGHLRIHKSFQKLGVKCNNRSINYSVQGMCRNMNQFTTVVCTKKQEFTSACMMKNQFTGTCMMKNQFTVMCTNKNQFTGMCTKKQEFTGACMMKNQFTAGMCINQQEFTGVCMIKNRFTGMCTKEQEFTNLKTEENLIEIFAKNIMKSLRKPASAAIVVLFFLMYDPKFSLASSCVRMDGNSSMSSDSMGRGRSSRGECTEPKPQSDFPQKIVSSVVKFYDLLQNPPIKRNPYQPKDILRPTLFYESRKGSCYRTALRYNLPHPEKFLHLSLILNGTLGIY